MVEMEVTKDGEISANERKKGPKIKIRDMKNMKRREQILYQLLWD